jgi:hypothetical protein
MSDTLGFYADNLSDDGILRSMLETRRPRPIRSTVWATENGLPARSAGRATGSPLLSLG